MIYRPEHFTLAELVGPDMMAIRGNAAWELLRAEALLTLDQLRARFGAIIVNDWASGGQYRQSGFREHDSKTGATWSMHKFGAAFDCKPRDVTPQEMHGYILAHSSEFPHLTTLEAIVATPTWVHFDCRNNAHSGIRIVNP